MKKCFNIKVRFHRGGLQESIQTAFETNSWKDFCKHCKDEDINIKTITCELYDKEPDTRIGWEQTWILCAKRKWQNRKDEAYPFGFSNENIMLLKRSNDENL